MLDRALLFAAASNEQKRSPFFRSAARPGNLSIRKSRTAFLNRGAPYECRDPSTTLGVTRGENQRSSRTPINAALLKVLVMYSN